jgi:hypothetical protein
MIWVTVEREYEIDGVIADPWKIKLVIEVFDKKYQSITLTLEWNKRDDMLFIGKLIRTLEKLAIEKEVANVPAGYGYRRGEDYTEYADEYGTVRVSARKYSRFESEDEKDGATRVFIREDFGFMQKAMAWRV